MTANHGVKKVVNSPGKRSVPAQKPRRVSAGKTATKKGKNDSPTVPRKPEDLIKEAMIRGQATPPASKRDAQYRKSYAYKIWKERGHQELASDATEGNGMSGTKNKLPPGIVIIERQLFLYIVSSSLRQSIIWPKSHIFQQVWQQAVHKLCLHYIRILSQPCVVNLVINTLVISWLYQTC